MDHSVQPLRMDRSHVWLQNRSGPVSCSVERLYSLSSELWWRTVKRKQSTTEAQMKDQMSLETSVNETHVDFIHWKRSALAADGRPVGGASALGPAGRGFSTAPWGAGKCCLRASTLQSTTRCVCHMTSTDQPIESLALAKAVDRSGRCRSGRRYCNRTVCEADFNAWAAEFWQAVCLFRPQDPKTSS